MLKIMLPYSGDLQEQAQEAGFSNIEDYIIQLIDRDVERRAIQLGIDDFMAGRVHTLEEVDAEIRQELGFPRPQ